MFKMVAKLLQVLLIFLAIFGGEINANRMVCYYGSWADYRPGDGKFVVEDIDPNLCTHVIYAFVVLGDNAGIQIRDPRDYDRFARFINLKSINPELKTMVAIGGWNDDPVRYSQTFISQNNRVIFAKNAVELLKKYGFDGLDIDWEYPGRRGGAPNDKMVYTELIKTVKEAFEPHGYLLTAAVSATEESLLISYEPRNLGRYLDFINVMTYDFHSGWEGRLGHNGPLYAPIYASGTSFQDYNVNASIQAWIRHGVPADKLVLGVGTYGQTFRATMSTCVEPGCTNFGPGWPGPFTQQDGMLGYNEICMKELELTYQKNIDEKARVPYLTRDIEYISYDNQQSAQEKVNYILANKLGGAMIWSIETDDFRGFCGKGRYPLLTVLKNGVIDGSEPTTAPPITTTTIEPTTTSTPSITTSIPSTTITIPSTTTEIPPTTVQSTATFPPTSTSIPSTTTTIPSTTTSIPSTTVTIPVTTTDIPLTTVQSTATFPPTSTSVPSTTTTIQSTTTSIPSTTVTIPSTTTDIPPTTVQSTVTFPPTTTSIPSTTISIPTTTITIPSTTTTDPDEFNPCTEVGLVRDPHDCKSFYYCRLVQEQFVYSKFVCPSNLLFDSNLFVCNYPENVDGCLMKSG